ncbi:hypothetical protein Sango_1596200 [Sesamum angolense]|uniref:Retrotransposon gag domain-containing protein n=1 Tax=Sesamum angolense TaxID=2727404 RepID=A0AAE2BTW6_9LAMI|nr:hypothetical protein Sango_1596200 [Sesamum angolense]
MDHMEALEKSMMEYSFPATDGTISSIPFPTIQANNYKIKSSIIQIILSSVQFSGLPKYDPDKHLSNFLEICDTFKFNYVSDDAIKLRIFPFSLCDAAKDWLQSLSAVWRQVQTFYNGVTLAKRATIDATAERINRRVIDVDSVDAITAFSAQMVALTQKMDNLGATMWNGAPLGPCDARGQLGHLSQNCQVIPNPINEDANFVSHGSGKSNLYPYSNTYGVLIFME